MLTEPVSRAAAQAKPRFYFPSSPRTESTTLTLLLSVSTRKYSDAVFALAIEALLTQHKVLSK
jgi:hypothetical protein